MPLVVAKDASTLLVLASGPPPVTVLADTSREVVVLADKTNLSVLVESPTAVVLADKPNPITVLGGVQGPQGPAGANGFLMTAGANLGGNRVVTGAASYADNTDLSSIGLAIGVTQGAASLGDQVRLISSGELGGFFGLTPNQPVYLSVNGTVTQTLPTSGYLQKIGVALSDTKIFINLSDPIGQI